jgi:hypothetical protein
VKVGIGIHFLDDTAVGFGAFLLMNDDAATMAITPIR